MPCGASTLLVQVVSENGGGNYDVRNFTSDDLNKQKDIGVNIIADKQHQFRIQAKVADYQNIACSDPQFSGELCYTKYVEPIDCSKERTIAIVVPIVTAIIGVIGGIGGTWFQQRCSKSSKSP